MPGVAVAELLSQEVHAAVKSSRQDQIRYLSLFLSLQIFI